MKFKITFVFLSFVILASCQNKKQNINNTNSIIEKLAIIENTNDSELLAQLLHHDAIVYIPDAPIIYGREVIIDLFKYSWSQDNSSFNSYRVDSIKENNKGLIEKGIYFYKDNKGIKKSMSLKITCIKKENSVLLKEINYNNSKKEIQNLPKPTGEYQIGQSTHYYEVSESRKRPIAFQIWYPLENDSNDKIAYQSKNVARSISNFLGWPSFNNSFTVLMRSNSIENAQVISNQKFPVVIYNHGYGGFSSVYQTVFEDLASNGYMVVSLGHKDESAMLIKEDGSVIENSSKNRFYIKRQPELNGREIGFEQAVILNSNNSDEVTKAYKKLVQLSPLHTESVNLWTLDTKNVIRELRKINKNHKQLRGSFDFDEMGIFGHSVGGATAGELASETLFKAGINIDGFQFGNLIYSNLKIPFMFISSNQEGDRYLRVSPFAINNSHDLYHTIISEFTHNSFSDLCLFTPNGEKDIQLQRELILSFFNKYLKNENVKLTNLGNKYSNTKIINLYSN